MSQFSINYHLDGVIRVREAFCTQKRDSSFTIWKVHHKLDVVIHLLYVLEQDDHLVLLDNAYDIIHISLPPKCGNEAKGSMHWLLKIFYIYVGYYWRIWGTHGSFLELFVELLLKGKYTVVQYQFPVPVVKWICLLGYDGNVPRSAVFLLVKCGLFIFCWWLPELLGTEMLVDKALTSKQTKVSAVLKCIFSISLINYKEPLTTLVQTFPQTWISPKSSHNPNQ